MTYDEVSPCLILGRAYTRANWETEGAWIRRPPGHPYACKWTPDAEPVPYVPTWDDLLADDWMVRFS